MLLCVGGRWCRSSAELDFAVKLLFFSFFFSCCRPAGRPPGCCRGFFLFSLFWLLTLPTIVVLWVLFVGDLLSGMVLLFGVGRDRARAGGTDIIALAIAVHSRLASFPAVCHTKMTAVAFHPDPCPFPLPLPFTCAPPPPTRPLLGDKLRGVPDRSRGAPRGARGWDCAPGAAGHRPEVGQLVSSLLFFGEEIFRCKYILTPAVFM